MIDALMILDHTFAQSPFFKLRHVRGMVRSFCSAKVFPAILKSFAGASVHSDIPKTDQFATPSIKPQKAF